MTRRYFDVIVVGGGHAGCEAAAAAARMGAQTALLTQKFRTVGEMSCNPAIGGIGKGHLVREIDALDGLMGRVADASGIQFRVLNKTKGPAVHGPRAQIDRALYRDCMQSAISAVQNLVVVEAEVESIEIVGRQVRSVVTSVGRFGCGSLVLTAGTFLNGMMFRGAERLPGGRVGDLPSTELSKSLKEYGLRLGRLKTGTPPRLDKRTIDFSKLAPQFGDDPPEPFSMLTPKISTDQVACHLTRTNARTHEIIRDNLSLSAMYSGAIVGRGPRYCPSIEDKVIKFADRDSHQIFLEPEGLNDNTIYPNGVSTSLPPEIQLRFLRTMDGLNSVEVVRPGYAIEYDFVDPTELKATLETKKIGGLFLAGQIVGTTGYEEAGALGLVAGMNAAAKMCGREIIFERSDAYVGVMIDDLVTRGVTEPYRMFTSRAEYRLSLRADNADQRLTQRGLDLGVVGSTRGHAYAAKKQRLDAVIARVRELSVSPHAARSLGIPVNHDGVARSAFELLSYPGIAIPEAMLLWPELKDCDFAILRQVCIEAKYDVYLARQAVDIAMQKREEACPIPVDLDYMHMSGLSNEVRSKLELVQPRSLGQAARIEGVTSAALGILLSQIRGPRKSRSIQT